MIDNNFPLYILSFIVSFVLTAFLANLIIPLLSKKAQQPIYTDGPSWHASKEGTPTMGGISFLIGISITLLLSSAFLFLTNKNHEATSVLLCLGFAITNSIIGIIDDITKLKRKQNAGLKPHEKLLLQFAVSILFIITRWIFIPESTVIEFSFGTYDIGIFYYPITILILVGITNCANLTDGIDGLATSVAFASALSFFYLSYSLIYDAAFTASALAGASVAFLIFNIHPAKIFMGDTGSLFLGALLSSMAVSMQNPLIILLIGGIYVIEGASVVLQVIWYKVSGKRLFKMAPIHHHLEKSGWSENKICIAAIVVTFLLSTVAYVFYLP